MGFHSKRPVFDQSVWHVCTTLCTRWWPVSHHRCLAAILLHFVSEESLRGVCDSSDRISREDSSRSNGVCCLPQLNWRGRKPLGPSSAESVRLHSCKQEKGWTGAERPNKPLPLQVLDTVFPTKRVTTRRAATTAVHQPPDSRPGAKGAQPTHSPRNWSTRPTTLAVRLQPGPRWRRVNSRVGAHLLRQLHNHVILSFFEQVHWLTRPNTDGLRDNIGRNVYL